MSFTDNPIPAVSANEQTVANLQTAITTAQTPQTTSAPRSGLNFRNVVARAIHFESTQRHLTKTTAGHAVAAPNKQPVHARPTKKNVPRPKRSQR